MAVSWLRQLAARSCVPVFPVWGRHDDALLATLALSPQIELVDSPRHASVLLVIGEIPVALRDGLQRVHDQLPTPFAAVWLRGAPLMTLGAPVLVERDDRLIDTLVRTHRELMMGQRESAPRQLMRSGIFRLAAMDSGPAVAGGDSAAGRLFRQVPAVRDDHDGRRIHLAGCSRRHQHRTIAVLLPARHRRDDAPARAKRVSHPGPVVRDGDAGQCGAVVGGEPGDTGRAGLVANAAPCHSVTG